MSRYELRWARRHPLRWVSIWWLHLLVAAMLAVLSVTWTADAFAIVTVATAWPLLLSWVGGLVLATTLAPFSRRLVAATGAAMITFGVLRAIALIEVMIHSDATTEVVVALTVYSLLVAALGAMWPTWTAACGARATVEAGADDRGGGGA